MALTSASDSVIATLYMKKTNEHRKTRFRTTKEMKSLPLNVRNQLGLASVLGGGGGGAAFADFLGRMFLKASSILIQLRVYNLLGSLKIIIFCQLVKGKTRSLQGSSDPAMRRAEGGQVKRIS